MKKARAEGEMSEAMQEALEASLKAAAQSVLMTAAERLPAMVAGLNAILRGEKAVVVRCAGFLAIDGTASDMTFRVAVEDTARPIEHEAI